MTILCADKRRRIIGFCKAEVRRVAQAMGGKAHLIYLAAATLFDMNLVLRLCTGSCLVFCIIVEVLEDEEKPQ